MSKEFEEFLDRKKPELRKMKDSDFTATPVNITGPIAKILEHSVESLSKKHQMDIMEIESGMVGYGLEKLEKLIQNKGPDYALNLIQEIIDASNKGDFEKMHLLIEQINKYAEGDVEGEENAEGDSFTYKGENGKDLSFEQFVKINEEKVTKKFESFKDEDFVIIKARNPENHEDIIELELHKSQIARMKKEAANIGIPMEEFAFLMVKHTLASLENTPKEEKEANKEFIDRQIKLLENKVKNDIQDSLEKISVGQLKEKLMQLHSISRKKLDKLEKSWKKEFKNKEISSQYRNEESYIKIKFASMLESGLK